MDKCDFCRKNVKKLYLYAFPFDLDWINYEICKKCLEKEFHLDDPSVLPLRKMSSSRIIELGDRYKFQELYEVRLPKMPIRTVEVPVSFIFRERNGIRLVGGQEIDDDGNIII